MHITASHIDDFAAIFWSQVDRRDSGECWHWRGQTDSCGYGRLSYAGSRERTHRLAYVLTNGPLSTGEIVQHTCDNPPCCNPAHLVAGTHQENAVDRDTRGRNGRAKVTPHDVLEVRRMFHFRRLTNKVIARVFHRPVPLIRRITSGITWKSIGRAA